MERLKKFLADDLNYWAVPAAGGCLFVVGHVLLKGSVLRGGLPNPWLVAGVLLGVFAVGLWLRQAWSRWVGLVLLAAFLAVVIRDLTRGPSVEDIVTVVILPFCLWLLWRLPIRPREDDEEAEEPLRSLVFLLREPRHLEAAILAHLASRAWGSEVEAAQPGGPGEDEAEPDAEQEEEAEDEDEEPKSMIVGESPHYLCMHWPGVFAIHHVDAPYFDEPEEVAGAVPELRARQAIEEHSAWLSIDLIQWFGEDDGNREAYRLMGRLLAEVADENTLAIVDPGEGWIVVYDPETEAKLRSDDPLAALRQRYYAPVIDVEEDDAAMQAAVAEARRRWPEFVDAFENRDPDAETPFSVKVPFTDGEHTEFMWVEVSGIENDVIYGTLGNEPVNVRNVAIGDRVRANVEDLGDWLYVADDEAVGGFSIRMLAQRLKEDRGEEPSGSA